MAKLSEIVEIAETYPTIWKTFTSRLSYEYYVLNHKFPEKFAPKEMFNDIIEVFNSFTGKEI